MSLSPEGQLLLACAKTHLTGADLAQIGRDLSHASIDWDRLTERACYHGVAPLLYNNLQHMDTPDVWSRNALSGLKRAYYATAARNGLLYQALHEMLHALKTKGIPVIVLKGAALAETVYPHRALRPMSDVDLLIHKADLPRVEDTLMGLGYMLRPHMQPKARSLSPRRSTCGSYAGPERSYCRGRTPGPFFRSSSGSGRGGRSETERQWWPISCLVMSSPGPMGFVQALKKSTSLIQDA